MVLSYFFIEDDSGRGVADGELVEPAAAADRAHPPGPCAQDSGKTAGEKMSIDGIGAGQADGVTGVPRSERVEEHDVGTSVERPVV